MANMFRNNIKSIETVAICCSTPFINRVPINELLSVFSGKKTVEKKWIVHFCTIFSDVPIEFIDKMIKYNNFDINIVKTVYESLPDALRGQRFKEYLKHA